MAGLRLGTGDPVSHMASCGMREMRPPGPQPTETALHEAALTHLARYATTEAGLIRVLRRRVDRWARAMEAESEIVAALYELCRVVARRLVTAGVVDDAAFAETRAASLTRAGRSRRAVAAHLQARGVSGEIADEALPQDGETELAAALAFTRRRRIGAFRREEVEADEMRAMGMLARAGFSRDVAMRALHMEPEEAEMLVTRLKQS